VSTFSIVYSETFARDQRRFVAQRDLLADLTLTVAEIARQPFKNPSSRRIGSRALSPA
jgi:hypothetical protein